MHGCQDPLLNTKTAPTHQRGSSCTSVRLAMDTSAVSLTAHAAPVVNIVRGHIKRAACRFRTRWLSTHAHTHTHTHTHTWMHTCTCERKIHAGAHPHPRTQYDVHTRAPRQPTWGARLQARLSCARFCESGGAPSHFFPKKEAMLPCALAGAAPFFAGAFAALLPGPLCVSICIRWHGCCVCCTCTRRTCWALNAHQAAHARTHTRQGRTHTHACIHRHTQPHANTHARARTHTRTRFYPPTQASWQQAAQW